MSIITTRITVGICTCRCASIVDTLASLAQVNLPLDTILTITVADQDDEPTAQTTVASAAAQHGLSITYLHIPGSIANARNACLASATGDYLAFIDDDKLADPNWLTALLTKQRSTNAAIVLGPVQAFYLPNAPRWVHMGNFHSASPSTPSDTLTTANVLMKLGTPALTNLRFTEHFSASGGEDADFFSRAVRAGAAITYAPTAFVYQGIPPQRATLGWLLQRDYRDGQTHAALLLANKKPRLWNMLLATIKMLRAYVMMLFCGLFPVDRRRWLLRGTRQLGVLRALYARGISQNA